MSNLSLIQGRTRSGHRATLLVNDDGSLLLGSDSLDSLQPSLYERVINSPDLVKTFQYADVGTADQRVVETIVSSDRIGAAFTDTYRFDGEPGKYRVISVTRIQTNGSSFGNLGNSDLISNEFTQGN